MSHTFALRTQAAATSKMSPRLDRKLDEFVESIGDDLVALRALEKLKDFSSVCPNDQHYLKFRALPALDGDLVLPVIHGCARHHASCTACLDSFEIDNLRFNPRCMQCVRLTTDVSSPPASPPPLCHVSAFASLPPTHTASGVLAPMPAHAVHAPCLF